MSKISLNEVTKIIQEHAKTKVNNYLLEAKQEKIMDELKKLYNEKQLEELFGKLGGGIGAVFNRGANVAKQGVSNALNTAGQAISNKAATTSQAIKNKVGQVSQGANNIANQVKQTYQQGAQAAELKAKQQQAAKVGAKIADLLAQKNALQAQYQQLTGKFFNYPITQGVKNSATAE